MSAPENWPITLASLMALADIACDLDCDGTRHLAAMPHGIVEHTLGADTILVYGREPDEHGTTDHA